MISWASGEKGFSSSRRCLISQSYNKSFLFWKRLGIDDRRDLRRIYAERLKLLITVRIERANQAWALSDLFARISNLVFGKFGRSVD